MTQYRTHTLLVAGLATILLQPSVATPLEFNDRAVCSGNATCKLISRCAAYSTRISIQRHRPPPCDFRGLEPLVCCPQRTTTPLFHCGNPNRTIYSPFGFASVPDPPDPKVGRPVFQLGRPPQGRTRTVRSADRQTRRRHLPPLQLPHSSLGGGLQTAEGIGGFDAELGRWPWIVLLGYWNRDQNLEDWFCGGALITTKHVITAAHCVSQQRAHLIGARIGDHNLTIDTEVQHQDRRVRSVAVHERYHRSQNDIALLTLTQPIKLTEAVRPVCLPPSDLELKVGQKVSMAGWGHLEFLGRELPDVLQEVPLKLANVDECEQAYREVPDFQDEFPGGFQGTKLCGTSIDGEIRGACDGDSGGPLMAHDGAGFSYIVGIVSSGIGCGNLQFPGVYTRVSSYIDWVFEKVNQ